MNNEYSLSLIRAKLSNELSLCECGRQRCDAGYTVGPDFPRPYYIVHYIKSGKGSLKNRFGEYALSAGQGFLITPGDADLIYAADKSDPWEYVWLGFDGAQAFNILADCNLSEQQPLFRDDTFAVLEFFDRINALDKRSKKAQLAAQGLMYLLFSALIGDKQFSTHNNKDALLSAAIDYIDKHLSAGVNINELSRNLYINRTALYRLFKEKLNLSPLAYIGECRLEKACDLLTHTPLSVTQISMYSGFCSASVFCRLFRERYAVTPGCYRRQQRDLDKNGG